MTEQERIVLLVEDEESYRQEAELILARRGFHCLVARSSDTMGIFDDALGLMNRGMAITALITDLRLPIHGSRFIGPSESRGSERAGFVLADEFRQRFESAPIVVWTTAPEVDDLREAVRRIGNTRFLAKADGAAALANLLKRLLQGAQETDDGGQRRCFIVHGHDDRTMNEIREFVIHTLGFPPPVVLREAPGGGLTILEKFEKYGQRSNLVFVLLTGDDPVMNTQGTRIGSRARQNVILELGYFMGLLGRRTGKIIILFRGDVEIPSDLRGITMIDISDGLQKAAPEIMREVDFSGQGPG